MKGRSCERLQYQDIQVNGQYANSDSMNAFMIVLLLIMCF